MAERCWSDADRDLVANAYHWAARNSCGRDNCPGALECIYAEHLDWDAFAAVLDALTAAGWMCGHCPVCYCPNVPYAGPPPTRRLVLDATPPTTGTDTTEET
jgi:hypothetical protein